VSQMLTLFTTPVVYLYLDRFREFCSSWFKSRKSNLDTVSTTLR